MTDKKGRHIHDWQFTKERGINWPESDWVARFVCHCGAVKWVKMKGDSDYYEKPR